MAYRSIFQDAIDSINLIIDDTYDPTGLHGDPRGPGIKVPELPELSAWDPGGRRDPQLNPHAVALPRHLPDRWGGPGPQAFLRSLPDVGGSPRSMVPWRTSQPVQPISVFSSGAMVSPLSSYYRQQLLPVTGLNGLGYRVEPGDKVLLAKLLFAEAAGVPAAYDDIAWSTINRVGEPRRGSTLSEIIYEPRQYSSVWETSDHALWKLAANPAALEGANAMAYRRALDRATAILEGEVPDESRGATYFFAGDPNQPPGWMKDDYGPGKRFRLVKSIGPKHFIIDTKSR